MQITITRTRLIVLGALLVGVAVLVFVDWVVVTDVEDIERTIDAFADAVEQNDFDACVPFFDDNCTLAGKPFRDVRKLCERAMQMVPVEEADAFDVEVTLDENDPDRARVKVRSQVRLDDGGGTYRVDWLIDVVRDGERDWKFVKLMPYWAGTQNPVFLTQIEWLLH